MDPIRVTLPIRTVSEANQREHWAVKAKRAKVQRFLARYVVWAEMAIRGWKFEGKAVITITRIAPRPLDTDNLAGSQKHTRDGIADALGIDDGDPRLIWLYAQRRGRPKEYAIEVLISTERTP